MRITETQKLYQEAIGFAALKHLKKNQVVPGTNLPYVVHLSNVAMEIFLAAINSVDFNLNLAIQASLLHDVVEDTETTYDEVEKHFGASVAQAVLALSKDIELPERERMADSIKRIKRLPREVWSVKLADRISNLQSPPVTWSREKIKEYSAESELILTELGEGNSYLAKRLKEEITQYKVYLDQ